MKKIMILGANNFLVPLIKTSKRLGFWTIVASPNEKETVKCAVVYYANNLKHYVPLEDLEALT